MIAFQTSSNAGVVVGALTRYAKAVQDSATKGLERGARYTRGVSQRIARRAPKGRADGWPGLFTGRGFAGRIRVDRPNPGTRVVTAAYGRAFRVGGTTKAPDELFLEGGDVLPSRFPEKVIRPKLKPFLQFQVGGRWVRTHQVRQRLIRWPLQRGRGGKALPGSPWTSRHRIDIPPYAVFDMAWPEAEPGVAKIMEEEQGKALTALALRGGR